jgi:hypothetical protein
MSLIKTRPAPKRLAVIIALQKLLEQISTADGDAHTMVGRVHRNRILFGQDVTGNPPALSILEAPKPGDALFGGEQQDHRSDGWTLLVQGIVEDTKRDDDADNAYFLCQDVERRLARISAVKGGSGSPKYPDAYLLGGMISAVEIAPPVVRPPEAGVSDNAFFYLPIKLTVSVEIGE